MDRKTSGTRTKAVVYLRVSTDQQSVENQRPELLQLAQARGFTDVEVIEDVMSAAKQRSGWDRVMAMAHRGHVKAVIVFALDRIGRSMSGNLNTVIELDRLGVEVISSREPWLQMQGPVRSLLVGVFSWVAEQEKIRIGERTRIGLQQTRAKGQVLGRPPVEFDQQRARQLHHKGVSLRQAAKKLGVSPSTLHRFHRAVPKT